MTVGVRPFLAAGSAAALMGLGAGAALVSPVASAPLHTVHVVRP